MTNPVQTSAKGAFVALAVLAAVAVSYLVPALLGSLAGVIAGGIAGAVVFDATGIDGQNCITLGATLGMLVGAGLAVILRARALRVA